MKTTLIMVLIGVLTVAPLIIIGAKHFDGTFTDNTYLKSLQYDQARKVSAESQVAWGEPACEGGECTAALSVTPAPDNASLSLRIFRPTANGDIKHTLEYGNNLWTVKFTPQGGGWYVLRLDYTVGGVMADAEHSVYLQ